MSKRLTTRSLLLKDYIEMINRRTIAAALIAASSLFMVTSAHAEGPMNEDVSQILQSAQSAMAAGQANDTAAFTASAEEALKRALAQNDVRTSSRLQIVISYLRQAVRKSKGGDQDGANQALADAVEELK